MMRMLEYRGKVYSVAELSQITGLPRSAIDSRLHRGWTVDRIVETPLNTSVHNIVHRSVKSCPQDSCSRAALSICKQISGDPEDHNFRRIAPGKYAFDGDILGWRIEFTNQGTAQLTAFYRQSGMMSDFKRTFKTTEVFHD